MKSVRWLVSYIIVASLGLWLAFAVSVKFMAPARSQEAPTSGELPAEFLKEVETNPATPTDMPAAATPTPSPAAGVPPAVPAPSAAANPEQPSAVPPPPEHAAEIPMDDGMTAPGIAPAVPTVRDGYVYDPTGKRDPFRAFRTVRPVLEKSKEAVEPLQRWETEKLQVVGILWDVGTPRAMIRDPEGAVHTIVKNSKVGRAEGFVTTIREGEVVVVETRYEDGKSFKETRVMELKK